MRDRADRRIIDVIGFELRTPLTNERNSKVSKKVSSKMMGELFRKLQSKVMDDIFYPVKIKVNINKK